MCDLRQFIHDGNTITVNALLTDSCASENPERKVAAWIKRQCTSLCLTPGEGHIKVTREPVEGYAVELRVVRAEVFVEEHADTPKAMWPNGMFMFPDEPPRYSVPRDIQELIDNPPMPDLDYRATAEAIQRWAERSDKPIMLAWQTPENQGKIRFITNPME